MKQKLHDSPYKDQLKRISLLVGIEQDRIFAGDVVFHVQNYVTTTNAKLMELTKKIAILEAELEKGNGS